MTFQCPKGPSGFILADENGVIRCDTGPFVCGGSRAVSLWVHPWAGAGGLADTCMSGFLEEKDLWERQIPYLWTHPTRVLLAFCKHVCVCSLPISKKVCFSQSTEAAAEAGVWLRFLQQPTRSTR